MRWQGQTIGAFDESALPGLNRIAGLMRTVTTPDFAGVTFHEVHAKSALNKVPGASSMPFKWTINPMRGCVHRCRYCFARKTHEYLDFDAGADFDSQIVVKVNVAEVPVGSWPGRPGSGSGWPSGRTPTPINGRRGGTG